jgi:hypothetical protein
MKKSFCIFFFCIAALGSLRAQETPSITNYVTDKYVDIHGSLTSIMPPTGFTRSETGFVQSKSDAMICVEHLHDAVLLSEYKFLRSFDTASHKDSAGSEMTESMRFRINGFEALLVKLKIFTNDDTYYGWRLYIGDENSSDVLTGSYLTEKESQLGNAIRTSLLSAFFDKDKRILPVGADPTTTSSSACKCNEKK